MNSEPNSAILFPVWKELYEQAKAWEYGSFHSHKEILAILRRRGPCDMKYYAAVKRAARDLRRVNLKQLVNVSSKGYRVIEAKEHDVESAKVVILGAKRIKAGHEIAQFTDCSRLTPEQGRRHADHLARIGQFTALAAASAIQIRRGAAGLPINRDVPKSLPAKVDTDA